MSIRTEVIRLRVDGIHYYESEGRVLIFALLLPCPPGFQLSNVTAQCECAPMLKDRGLLCNISGTIPLVQRTVSTWISTHHNGKGILLHDHCPLHYCKPTQLWLHRDHPDEQCARGRSGILCGIKLQFKPQSDSWHFPVFRVYKCLSCSSLTICTSWTNASAATDYL